MSMNSYALQSAATIGPGAGAATAPPNGPAQEVGTQTGVNTTPGNIAGWQQAEINDNTFLAYIVAWGIFLLLMMLLNRTRWGHSLIYYGLALALLLLLVGNYQAIGNLLAPLGGTPGQEDQGPPTISEPPGPPDGGHPGPGPVPNLRTTTTPIVAAAPRFGISGTD